MSPISDDYRKGFEDARKAAIGITYSWQDWDLMNGGRTAIAIRQQLERMTPDLYVQYQAERADLIARGERRDLTGTP